VIHLDPARRHEAIEAGWLAYMERTPGMEDAYRAACGPWQVIAVVSGAEVIGALYARDGVIHVGIVPDWRSRWASRRLIREMFGYGTQTTLLPNESREFVHRCFKIEGIESVIR
jgi:hypothetical protein